MISTTLKSRSHNELVVDKLQFYVDYMKQTKYFLKDVYGELPFKVIIDKNQFQLLDEFVKIKMISSDSFQLTATLPSDTVEIIRYIDGKKEFIKLKNKEFKGVYKLGEDINLPFLHLKLIAVPYSGDNSNEEILIRCNNFDTTVSACMGINVVIDEKAGSILKLGMQGNNKNRLVDLLNTTVGVLIKRQLESKNKFADNTIEFIDEKLKEMEGDLKDSGNELKEFGRNNNIIDIEEGGISYKEQLQDYDEEKYMVERKISYLKTLGDYLKNSVDYSKLPAPTVAGIDEININSNVSKLILLSIQRSELAYSVKGGVYYERIDNEMSSVKKVLIENISSYRNVLQSDLINSKQKIAKIENEISKLPQNKQEWLNISRKYNLSDNIYNTFLQKRSEASIVKAANLSDIVFIDPAKDVGGGLMGPKTSVNYVLAFFMGLIIPLILVFFIFFITIYE